MGSSVIVGDEGAPDWRADLPVVPDGGVEREQPLDDPRPQPGGDAAAVPFEAQLVLQGPDDGLNALAQPVREGPGCGLVFCGPGGSRSGPAPGWRRRLRCPRRPGPCR